MFSVETENLIFISNCLINEEDINLISKEFLKIKDDSYNTYFLNKKIDLKNPYAVQFQNFSYLEKINYFFKNVINLSPGEFKAIVKQSIPDRSPFFYSESILEIV